MGQTPSTHHTKRQDLLGYFHFVSMQSEVAFFICPKILVLSCSILIFFDKIIFECPINVPERTFNIDLRKYIPECCGKLVLAGLTILRAYHVAGRPKQEIKQFGRFEEWSDWIMSSLIWLGMADSCASRKEIDNADPIRQSLGILLPAWFDVCDNLSF